MLEQIKNNFFFAVIRGEDYQDGVEIGRAAICGGIKNIEITYTTPNASQVIADLRQEFSDDLSVIVGAGTVINEALAVEAIEAGAAFLVSPHFSKKIQLIAEKAKVPYFPGCATATEIVEAMDAGCSIIKLFPGGTLGPNFIKAIHGPIPGVDLMPSGGVTIENVALWKKAGACAVGIGSALQKKVATEGYESVSIIAQEFIKAAEV